MKFALRSKQLIILGFIVFTSFTLGTMTGCGKKGDPKPPEETAPVAVRSLTAVGEVEGVRFSWEAPETNAKGDDLSSFKEFQIKRSNYVKGERAKWEVIGTIAQNNADQFAPYSYLDTKVVAGSTYEYAIVCVNEDGTEGAIDRIQRITFLGLSSRIENI
jgi:hypothetical protein